MSLSKAFQNVEKLENIVCLSDFDGADPTAATASDTAFTAAVAELGTNGGSIIVDGAFYLAGGISLPDGVFLRGFLESPGQKLSGDYTPTNFASVLVLGGVVTHGDRCGVEDLIVIQKNLTALGAYPTPFASAIVAAAAVAAFSGNAFQPAGYNADFRLRNVLVLGFSYVYNGLAATGLNRPLFERVYFDCTNGIHLVNAFDWPKARECEAWEFLTTNQSYTGTTDLITRTGVAFYAGPGADWMDFDDCREFGWQTGFLTDGAQDVVHRICKCDGPTGQAQSNSGFRYTGAIESFKNIGCTVAAQNDAGIVITTTPVFGVNHATIIGLTAHGNDSANGYIHIGSGTANVTASTFHDNPPTGHIHLDAGVGTVTLSDNCFSNGAGLPVITGDAAAVAKAQWGPNVFAGNSTPQPLPTWVPGLSSAAGTGLAFSVDVGNFVVAPSSITVNYKLTVSALGSASGALTLTNLPGTVSGANGSHGGGLANYVLNFTGLSGPVITSGIEGTTTAAFYQSSATGMVPVTVANIAVGSIIDGTFTFNI